MELSLYTTVPNDFLVISASRLYAIIDLNDCYVARGLEYYEAAVELLTLNDCEYAVRPDGHGFRLYWGAPGKLRPTVIVGEDEVEILVGVIRQWNAFGDHRVVEEKLTCESWWQFNQPGDTAIYAWGDEDHATIARDYLDSQRVDGDDIEFEMRELRLREAFALRKTDGEHWYDLDDLIQTTRASRVIEFADAIQRIKDCAARADDVATAGLLSQHIAGAIRIDRQLAALEQRGSNVSKEVAGILGRQGWLVDGDRVVRWAAASASLYDPWRSRS